MFVQVECHGPVFCKAGTQTPRKVVIAGHSLGGAIANLAGPWAALQWPSADIQVITSGAPTVGNQQFGDVSLVTETL